MDRRDTARELMQAGLSERRAAHVVQISRSLLRYQSRKVKDEVLEGRLRQLSEK